MCREWLSSILRLAGVLLVLVVLAMATLGCSAPASDDADGDTNRVVLASTSIWADIVDNITCGELDSIETLIRPGSDPHAYEPSLADRAKIDNAALVVVNGLGLEEGLDDTLSAAAEQGATIVRVGEQMPTLGSNGETNPERADPHVWFDPVRVADVLPWLATELVAAADLDPIAIDRCMTDYQVELRSLDAELTAQFATLALDNRKLVTNHDAFVYLADRYGFEIIATVIPSSSTMAETSPAQLEELARLVEAQGVSAIFTEVQSSSDDAEALAARLDGVELIELHTGSLGRPGSGIDSYVDLLRVDARLITEGLTR